MSKPGAIKISLGAKKSTVSSGPNAGSQNKSSSRKTELRQPAKKLFLTADDEEDEPDEGRAVEVTHFDQEKGGAHHASKQKLPRNDDKRVIMCEPNRNWRDEAARKRQKSSLPGRGAGSRSVGDDQAGVMVAGNMKYGLNIKQQSKPKHKKTLSGDSDWSLISCADDDGELVPRIDEDELRRQPTMKNISAAFEEERAYEDDLEKAPEPPSLDDYEKVPVEGFGLAMLRGMGLKEETKKEDKTKKGVIIEKRRPALLGIGAKPMEDEKK